MPLAENPVLIIANSGDGREKAGPGSVAKVRALSSVEPGKRTREFVIVILIYFNVLHMGRTAQREMNTSTP